MQIRLSCGANGSPDPVFAWYKDDAPLEPTNRIKIKSTVGMSSVIIEEAETSDAGVYKVTAKNRVAEIATEAEVLIEGKISYFILFLNLVNFNCC